MLFSNLTSELVPFQFSSIASKKLQCFVNIRLLLQVHFLVSTLIHAIFAYMYMGLFLGFVISYIGFPSVRRFIRDISPYIQLQSYTREERYFYVSILLIKETALTFVYVLLAFLHKRFGLVNNDSSITRLNFCRWVIEGSFAPFLFGAILVEYYIGYSNTAFDPYQCFYIIAIALKVPLYLLMRCAESRPDFFLNRFESLLVSKFCEPHSKRDIFLKFIQFIR